jgi:hypothetical protein
MSSVCLHAQTVNSNSQFLIDGNRPFVYVEFDHIGPGEPRNGDEPKTRIWLHLNNNCRIPIAVRANGVPDGSPKDAVGVMHDVVADPPSLEITMFPAQTAEPSAPSGEDRSKTIAEQMPRGYMEEVGSAVTIMPGENILLSVPVNHVSKYWHIEIPFDFVLPKGRGFRDSKVSLGPTMVIAYSIWDVPPGERVKIEKH